MSQALNFLKMRQWHRCFPVNTFFIEHLWWLLLKKEMQNVKNRFLHCVTCQSSFHINSIYCTNVSVGNVIFIYLGQRGFPIFNEELKIQILVTWRSQLCSYGNCFMTEVAIVQKPVNWTTFYMIANSIMKDLI